MDDELVLVASWSDPTLDLAGRNDFVDWRLEFVHTILPWVLWDHVAWF